MQELLQLDTDLFLKIHQGLSNNFFDWLMPLVRNRFLWIPLYIFIIVFCIANYKKTGLYIIAGIVLTFALSDIISSRVIKPQVNRLRPCNEIALASHIIPRVHCGTGKSFPSAHAANHFGIAVFLIGIFYKKWRAILPIGLGWAALISFAQVYVGVHYPLDVFAGMVLGTILALFTLFLYQKVKPKS